MRFPPFSQVKQEQITLVKWAFCTDSFPPHSSAAALGGQFCTWKCEPMHLSPGSLSCLSSVAVSKAEKLMVAQKSGEADTGPELSSKQWPQSVGKVSKWDHGL